MARDRPDLLHHILEINCRAVSAYLNAQIDAGAQAVMLFDTWGGTLTTAGFHEFSLPYMQRVVGALKREREGERVPSILFTKGGGAWLEAIAASGAPARRRTRCRSRKSRSCGAARRSSCGAQRRGCGSSRLRPRFRSCFQFGARHISVHAAGKCSRAGRRGARTEPRLSLKTRASPGFTGKRRRTYAHCYRVGRVAAEALEASL